MSLCLLCAGPRMGGGINEVHQNKTTSEHYLGDRTCLVQSYFPHDSHVEIWLKMKPHFPRPEENGQRAVYTDSFLSLLCSLNCCWPHDLCSIPLLLQATTTTGRGRRSVGGVPDDRRVELGGVDVNDVKGRTDGQLPQQGQGTAVHHGERTCVWGGHMRHR